MPFRSSGRGAYGPQGQRVLRGPLAPVWVTSGSIGSANLGSAVSVQLTATDDSGIAPTYTLASGSLPTGLSLSSSGLVSGTLSGSAGTFNFTVRATDENGRFTDSSTLSYTSIQPAWTSLTLTTTTTGQNGPTSTSQVGTSYTGSAPTFSVSSGYIYLTVPATGTYRIMARGARGGQAGAPPGYGAAIQGDFSLTAGNTLCILIGQVGANPGDTVNYGGGGGGMTAVTLGTSNTSSSILVVAGGGGGSTASYQGYFPGQGGLTSNSGDTTLSGGSYGAAGASFSTNGQNGATSFRNGGTGGTSGGTAGGVGGFGGASGAVHHPGGGAGGYTGGWGGQNFSSTSGGGGGSINNGSNQSNTANSNNGPGQVVITRL